jgi:hypothetical protein
MNSIVLNFKLYLIYSIIMDSFKDNLGVFTDKYEEVENNSDKLVKYQSVIKLKRSSENIQLLISLSEDEAEEK